MHQSFVLYDKAAGSFRNCPCQNESVDHASKNLFHVFGKTVNFSRMPNAMLIASSFMRLLALIQC